MADSPQTFLDGRVVLHAGDCLDVLDALPAHSVDAVITDPPYHFNTIVKRFGGEASAPAQFGTDGAFARASAGFMGKSWDGGDIAFRPETWAKVLRVLKPGGHLAAFSAPKCVHKMGVAIELAGFEIRDRIPFLFDPDPHVVAFLESLTPAQADALFRLLDHFGPLGEAFWTFGSGFPKSHDVSKAIDKARNDVSDIRVVCRAIRAAMDRRGLKSSDLAPQFDNCHARLIDHWAARDTDSQPSLPMPDQWAKLLAAFPELAELDGEAKRLNARKGEFGEDWKAREITGDVKEWSDRSNYALTSRDGVRRDNPKTAAALEWAGWGTALKPAYEPILIARAPLAEKSVAAQVLATGTGAINIDAARIGTESTKRTAGVSPSERVAFGKYAADQGIGRVEYGSDAGRFPANLAHDGSDAVLAGFPDSDGAVSNGRKASRGIYDDGIGTSAQTPGFADSGSAARFFYTAKADAHDRVGSGHPTVEPLDLMQWLARMLCPPGGTILDPFAGTGTTAEAAFREGFNAVLIEREAEYRADIARRMDLVLAGPATRSAESVKAKAKRRGADDHGPLFAEAS